MTVRASRTDLANVEGVTLAARETLQTLRRNPEEIGSEPLAQVVAEVIDAVHPPRIGRVVNATGTILHTNLGRAPLSPRAIEAMAAAAGSTDLELSTGTGKRAPRLQGVERLLCSLVCCEAAIVAVNNAAAVLLALRVAARGKDVIISRGQLVEIGDGFRLEDIIGESGGRLVEVGATNRTSVEDYARALSERTGVIMVAHRSNFELRGFVAEPTVHELARLAHGAGIPLVVDNGSGALVDTKRFGVEHEPTPSEALQAGADAVTFSTDKLLGGPQGGVIAGRADLVHMAGRCSLYRALRPDKLVLAALQATLHEYLAGQQHGIPVLRMMAATVPELRLRADSIVAALGKVQAEVTAVDTISTIGGGSLPGQTLKSVGVALVCSAIKPVELAKALRESPLPVITRIEDERVVLDLRTVDPEADGELITKICATLSRVVNRHPLGKD
jgi:L-seryl-tRNA(Ser) seleniumtransferase